ncbi:uncharacterized protein LOC143198603 isoform X2 [Rhynchophorus ferrugineus]|uniref:uncharacterized protein LOC143198603 isoform X2 n=1 Tax=Rhynchophorus ferrugineus TaxID=354439 RepID=UPI003FCD5111
MAFDIVVVVGVLLSIIGAQTINSSDVSSELSNAITITPPFANASTGINETLGETEKLKEDQEKRNLRNHYENYVQESKKYIKPNGIRKDNKYRRNKHHNKSLEYINCDDLDVKNKNKCYHHRRYHRNGKTKHIRKMEKTGLKIKYKYSRE